jgi:hypothetical protein
MNIDGLIEELWNLREEKRGLAQREKQINERYDILKRTLIDSLDTQGVKGASTTRARVVITESEIVTTTDWEAFCEYIRDNDAFHLLQKKPSSVACKELTTIQGEPPPGIDFLKRRDISLTTL